MQSGNSPPAPAFDSSPTTDETALLYESAVDSSRRGHSRGRGRRHRGRLPAQPGQRWGHRGRRPFPSVDDAADLFGTSPRGLDAAVKDVRVLTDKLIQNHGNVRDTLFQAFVAACRRLEDHAISREENVAASLDILIPGIRLRNAVPNDQPFSVFLELLGKPRNQLSQDAERFLVLPLISGIRSLDDDAVQATVGWIMSLCMEKTHFVQNHDSSEESQVSIRRLLLKSVAEILKKDASHPVTKRAAAGALATIHGQPTEGIEDQFLELLILLWKNFHPEYLAHFHSLTLAGCRASLLTSQLDDCATAYLRACGQESAQTPDVFQEIAKVVTQHLAKASRRLSVMYSLCSGIPSDAPLMPLGIVCRSLVAVLNEARHEEMDPGSLLCVGGWICEWPLEVRKAEGQLEEAVVWFLISQMRWSSERITGRLVDFLKTFANASSDVKIPGLLSRSSMLICIIHALAEGSLADRLCEVFDWALVVESAAEASIRTFAKPSSEIATLGLESFIVARLALRNHDSAILGVKVLNGYLCEPGLSVAGWEAVFKVFKGLFQSQAFLDDMERLDLDDIISVLDVTLCERVSIQGEGCVRDTICDIAVPLVKAASQSQLVAFASWINKLLVNCVVNSDHVLISASCALVDLYLSSGVVETVAGGGDASLRQTSDILRTREMLKWTLRERSLETNLESFLDFDLDLFDSQVQSPKNLVKFVSSIDWVRQESIFSDGHFMEFIKYLGLHPASSQLANIPDLERVVHTCVVGESQEQRYKKTRVTEAITWMARSCARHLISSELRDTPFSSTEHCLKNISARLHVIDTFLGGEPRAFYQAYALLKLFGYLEFELRRAGVAKHALLTGVCCDSVSAYNVDRNSLISDFLRDNRRSILDLSLYVGIPGEIMYNAHVLLEQTPTAFDGGLVIKLSNTFMNLADSENLYGLYKECTCDLEDRRYQWILGLISLLEQDLVGAMAHFHLWIDAGRAGPDCELDLFLAGEMLKRYQLVDSLPILKNWRQIMNVLSENAEGRRLAGAWWLQTTMDKLLGNHVDQVSVPKPHFVDREMHGQDLLQECDRRLWIMLSQPDRSLAAQAGEQFKLGASDSWSCLAEYAFPKLADRLKILRAEDAEESDILAGKVTSLQFFADAIQARTLGYPLDAVRYHVNEVALMTGLIERGSFDDKTKSGVKPILRRLNAVSLSRKPQRLSIHSLHNIIRQPLDHFPSARDFESLHLRDPKVNVEQRFQQLLVEHDTPTRKLVASALNNLASSLVSSSPAVVDVLKLSESFQGIERMLPMRELYTDAHWPVFREDKGQCLVHEMSILLSVAAQALAGCHKGTVSREVGLYCIKLSHKIAASIETGDMSMLQPFSSDDSHMTESHDNVLESLRRRFRGQAGNVASTSVGTSVLRLLEQLVSVGVSSQASSGCTSSSPIQPLRAGLNILQVISTFGQAFPDLLKNVIRVTPGKFWLPSIPQLLSHLNVERARGLVEEVLVGVARSFPLSLLYPALRSSPCWRFCRIVMEQVPAVYGATQTLVAGLNEISELWDERCVNEISAMYSSISRKIYVIQHRLKRACDQDADEFDFDAPDSCFQAELERLEHLKQSLENPTTQHEVWFVKAFGQRFKEIMNRIATARGLRQFQASWEEMSRLQRDITRGYAATRILELPKISVSLAYMNLEDVYLPGVVGGVMGIRPMISILPTKTRPKKFIVDGSDGTVKTFLLKGVEDLKSDERIMQLLTYVGKMPGLGGARTYEVIPLGDRCGLLQWVDNCVPGFQLWRKSMTKHAQPQSHSEEANGKARSGAASKPLEQYHQLVLNGLKTMGLSHSKISRNHWPQCLLLEVYKSLLEATPRDLLSCQLYLSSHTPTHFLRKQRVYAKSMALNSMLGYVIGLGDRHLDNLLLDIEKGEVVNIDFNVSFDRGKRLRVPETVPFRLTQNFEYALGLFGAKGLFRESCRRVIAALREEQDTWRKLLDVFIHDPLFEWHRHVDRAPEVIQFFEIFQSMLGKVDEALKSVKGDLGDLIKQVKIFSDTCQGFERVKRGIPHGGLATDILTGLRKLESRVLDSSHLDPSSTVDYVQHWAIAHEEALKYLASADESISDKPTFGRYQRMIRENLAAVSATDRFISIARRHPTHSHTGSLAVANRTFDSLHCRLMDSGTFWGRKDAPSSAAGIITDFTTIISATAEPETLVSQKDQSALSVGTYDELHRYLSARLKASAEQTSQLTCSLVAKCIEYLAGNLVPAFGVPLSGLILADLAQDRTFTAGELSRVEGSLIGKPSFSAHEESLYSLQVFRYLNLNQLVNIPQSENPKTSVIAALQEELERWRERGDAPAGLVPALAALLHMEESTCDRRVVALLDDITPDVLVDARAGLDKQSLHDLNKTIVSSVNGVLPTLDIVAGLLRSSLVGAYEDPPSGKESLSDVLTRFHARFRDLLESSASLAILTEDLGRHDVAWDNNAITEQVARQASLMDEYTQAIEKFGEVVLFMMRAKPTDLVDESTPISASEYARSVVVGVMDKINGVEYDQDSDKQVEELIGKATDPDQLSQMYEGWIPWV